MVALSCVEYHVDHNGEQAIRDRLQGRYVLHTFHRGESLPLLTTDMVEESARRRLAGYEAIMVDERQSCES